MNTRREDGPRNPQPATCAELLRDGAAAIVAFLCDGAAAADGANAQLLRDGAASVAAFLCDGAAAADGANAELLRDGCSGVPL